MQAHQITLQALFDIWLGAFLEDHPAVGDTLYAATEQLTTACRTNEDVPRAHQAFLMKL